MFWEHKPKECPGRAGITSHTFKMRSIDDVVGSLTFSHIIITLAAHKMTNHKKKQNENKTLSIDKFAPTILWITLHRIVHYYHEEVQ